MNVEQVCKQLELHVLVGEDLSREVTGGYTGDLLSWVMARLPADAVWFTVMGNVNAIAVASLADAACIVLTCQCSSGEPSGPVPAGGRSFPSQIGNPTTVIESRFCLMFGIPASPDATKKP